MVAKFELTFLVISLVLRRPNFFKALRIFIEVFEHKMSSISGVESMFPTMDKATFEG